MRIYTYIYVYPSLWSYSYAQIRNGGRLAEEETGVGDARWDLASVYSCTVPGRGRGKV